MIRRIFALILVLCFSLCIFAGCDAVSDIASAAVEAAKQEVENQVKAKLEEYKVTIVEGKSAFGALNDEGGKYQFFYAILVQTNTESAAADCANALNSAFGNAGYVAQTAPEFENEHLVHKTITFNRTDFSAGNYYTVYLYLSDLTGWVEKLPELTFPTIPQG